MIRPPHERGQREERSSFLLLSLALGMRRSSILIQIASHILLLSIGSAVDRGFYLGNTQRKEDTRSGWESVNARDHKCVSRLCESGLGGKKQFLCLRNCVPEEMQFKPFFEEPRTIVGSGVDGGGEWLGYVISDATARV